MIKFIVFKAYKWLQKQKKVKFDRYLPLNELLIDRSKKAELLKFGKGTTIHDSSHVYGDVTVGENTWIGPFTILDGSGILIIGSNCSISSGVQIYTHDTIKWAVSGGESPCEYGNVVVEDNCYIGPNSIIEKGVTLKSGTIVGANSFVNKTFPEGSKIAGNQSKQI
jgi:acetyltransferase-like isoleucine patch superfamily enzyme